MRTDKKLWRNRKARKELARQLQSENPGLEVVHPHAAGIDVGNSAHYVAVLTKENGPEPLSSGPFVLLATYAAICFTNGAVVLISIFRGKAATVIGAVISNTPFTYSAVNFSTITPSGSVIVLSNTP